MDAGGNWTNWYGPWNSGLQIHAAGYLDGSSSLLINRGVNGDCWSSTQYNTSYAWLLDLLNLGCNIDWTNKTLGLSVRCVREN